MNNQIINESLIEIRSRSCGSINKAGILLLAALLIVGQAAEASDEAQESPERFLSGRVEISLGGVTQSEVGDSDSGYALLGGTIDVEVGPVIAGIKRLEFDWSNPGDFVEQTGGQDPWGALNQILVGLKHGGVLSEKLMYEVTLGIATGFEDQMSGSYAGFVGGYGIYAFNEKWAASFGAFFSRHQEIKTDFDFIPIIGVSYNMQATNGLSFTFGLPTTDLTWHFSETTRLILGFSSLEGGVFRLANDNPVREEGYVELVSATAILTLETQLPKGIELGVGVGHAFDRKMTLYDSDGGNEKTYDIEKKPGFVLSLSRSF